MRTAFLLAAIAASLAFFAFLPAPADARSVACTDAAGANCGGFVCADKNLDGTLTSDECVIFYCVESECGCDPNCPQWA